MIPSSSRTPPETTMKLTKYLHRVYLVSLNCLLTFAASVENSTVEPTTARAERSLGSGLAFVDANSIDRDDPAASLDGVYSECLLNLSFPCLQKKIIVFLDRLGRKKQVSLIGDFLTVVRTGPVSATVSEETTARRDESSLRSVIDGQVDRFFETHVLRVRVPSFLDDPGTENTVVDIDFGTGASTSEGEFIFLCITFFLRSFHQITVIIKNPEGLEDGFYRLNVI